MNDKEYEQKIQAALADLKELINKHRCFVTFDPTLTAFCISINVDEKTPEVLAETLENRWMGMVVSPGAILYTCMSPEIKQHQENCEKLELLSKLLDPMEWTQILMRIRSGEDVASILVTYQEVINQYEQNLQSINNDPTQLLSTLDGLEIEQEKKDDEDPMDFEGFDDM